MLRCEEQVPGWRRSTPSASPSGRRPPERTVDRCGGAVHRRHRWRAAAVPGPPARRGPRPARRGERRAALPRRACGTSRGQPTWSCYRSRHAPGARGGRVGPAPRRAVAFDVDDLIFDPSIGRRDPRARLLPLRRPTCGSRACAGTATPWRHATPTSGRPSAGGARRRRGDIEAHLFENGVGSGTGSRQRGHRAGTCSPVPGRRGSATSAAPPPTTTTGDRGGGGRGAGRAPDAELWLGGHLRPTADAGGARRASAPPALQPNGTELPDVLRQLDVNLAPLEPGSRFNDAKSAIKWMEAALVATPTIASPSAPFRMRIEPGRTGWLAEDPDDWRPRSPTCWDADARARVGACAQREALLRWSPHLQGARYLAILEQIVASTRAPAASPLPRGTRSSSTSRSWLTPPRWSRTCPACRGPPAAGGVPAGAPGPCGGPDQHGDSRIARRRGRRGRAPRGRRAGASRVRRLTRAGRSASGRSTPPSTS